MISKVLCKVAEKVIFKEKPWLPHACVSQPLIFFWTPPPSSGEIPLSFWGVLLIPGTAGRKGDEEHVLHTTLVYWAG